jgi:alpha-beta hydrolase superfamily lysophospholipase
MLALVEEVVQPGFVGSVSLDWKNKVKLTSDLVILGHSFGGITALGAAKDCDAAKAVCVMDPWFWPKKDETFGAADHQKTFIVMTEHFPKFLKNLKVTDYMDTFDHIRKFGANSKF